MRVLLLALLVCVCFAALLNLIEPVTRRCRRQILDIEAVGYKVEETGTDEELSAALPDIPETSRPGFHLRAVLSKEGLLGFLFLLLFVAFLPLNSRILAESFEVLLDRP